MSKAKNEISKSKILSLLIYQPANGCFRWKYSRGRICRLSAAGTIKRDGYRYITIFGKSFPAHRLAYFLVNGYWPETVDHINNDKKDNRAANIRRATQSENNQNRGIQRNNKSGVKGVTWNKQRSKWAGYVWLNRKMNHLGYYANFDDAVAAVAVARKKLHGEFCNHGEAA